MLLWLEDLAAGFLVSFSLLTFLSEDRVIRATIGSLVHLGLLPDSKYSTSSAGAGSGAEAGLWRSLFPKDHRSGSILVLVGLFMLMLRPWIPRTKGLVSNPPKDTDIYTILSTWWKTLGHNKTSEQLWYKFCQATYLYYLHFYFIYNDKNKLAGYKLTTSLIDWGLILKDGRLWGVWDGRGACCGRPWNHTSSFTVTI